MMRRWCLTYLPPAAIIVGGMFVIKWVSGDYPHIPTIIGVAVSYSMADLWVLLVKGEDR